jgi:predicted ATP-dependent serine protease
MRTEIKNTRKPMSPEAKAKIAASVRAAAERKRAELGISAVKPKETKPIELVRMCDQKFDPSLFEPMSTGKPIDSVFSSIGGIPKATNYMIVGDPGVGKSTVSLDILSDLTAAGLKTLFISAEMTRIDLFGYVQRYPKFGHIDCLFLGEYLEEDPKVIFETSLSPGYDVVLIDSFAEVLEAIKSTAKLTTSSVEKFLIDTMIRHNLAENDSLRHTTFLVIQQVTKGGEFVGSNKLKHNLTGMMEIRFDKTGETFFFFSKNRRGDTHKRMYYSLKSKGDVYYDLSRYENDGNAREDFDDEL